ncbi:hypothetical protein NFI96_020242, partial [Prochilodus magdalenae]
FLLFSCLFVTTKRRRPRKRGRRAGVLVRLRQRANRPPLPTILLSNVQSRDNKISELRAQISFQRETQDCCILCLTETWLSPEIPNEAIEPAGFSVHRADRTKDLSGKSKGGDGSYGHCKGICAEKCQEEGTFWALRHAREIFSPHKGLLPASLRWGPRILRYASGGGVCFMINNVWCDQRNVHFIESFCSPDIEYLIISCRPRWMPREISGVILTAVYIPPQADTDLALGKLYKAVNRQETTRPEAACIVVGDFNTANFRKVAPKFVQHVLCSTRGSRTLDHCYTPFRDEYKARPRPPFGKSDHSSILLLPTYRQKLKQVPPTIREVHSLIRPIRLHTAGLF